VTAAGFAVVILIFFYYLAFILLVGAELNSTLLGLRPTTKSLSALLQSLQEQDLMIEPENAASATEQLAETSRTATGPRKRAASTLATGSPDTPQFLVSAPVTVSDRSVVSVSEQATLAAILVGGAIAVIGVLRLVARVLHSEK